MPSFHSAFPLTEPGRTRRFCADRDRCTTGRAAERRIGFDFFGQRRAAPVFADPSEDRPEAEAFRDTASLFAR